MSPNAERTSGSSGRFCVGLAGQSALGDLSEERAGRPFAGGVLLEGPEDEGSAVGVDLDGADFSAALDLADVDVADGCAHRRAAVLGFLDQSLVDLVGEVAGVELGDRTHDPVQQDAARRLVDVLGAGDQGRPGTLQRNVDFDIVDAVAGQPVDLVHDHVLDAVLLNVGHHGLQSGSVGAASALPAIRELFGYGRAERGRLAAAGITLGGDRESFGFTAAGCLVLGRDTQVDDRFSRPGNGLASGGEAPQGALCLAVDLLPDARRYSATHHPAGSRSSSTEQLEKIG